jgi:peptide-methionine (S)-S-oxide reductase
MAKATFAAGCFWGVEAAFYELDGVISTTVGYTGGKTIDPTYQEVCTDRTGHAEAVQIEFDTDKISYHDLLNVFWSIHDPTQLNRQGPDMGSQYRSAIFFHTPDQEAEARTSKESTQKSSKLGKDIVTEIVPATEFYNAEEYHQKYFLKHKNVACKRS